MKSITLSIIVVTLLVVGALMLSQNKGQEINVNNVSMIDGKQIIDLTAKGGYSPSKSVAKAGVPTILRFTTNGTFDCSSSVRIPVMNLSQNLALSGKTDIDLGNPKEGILRGSCGMGMYPFEINFKI